MLIMLIPFTAEAQRMKHKSGGNRNRTNQNFSKPNTQPNRSINGGYQKSTSRDLSKRKTTQRPNQNIKRDINKTNINQRHKSIDRK